MQLSVELLWIYLGTIKELSRNYQGTIEWIGTCERADWELLRHFGERAGAQVR